jgi:hypothetical protein
MPKGALSNPGGSTSFETIDVIRMAMQELGSLDPQEVPTASEGQTGLAKVNRLLDSWNAVERFIYGHQFFVGIITPNLQPHLIGPSGTANFVMNQRPVKIEGANILLNYPGPQTTRVRVEVHQDKGIWYENQLAPSIASVLPTDLYYQTDWPNGSMFLWVVPTVALPLELRIWTVLSQVGLNDSISLPPGYLEGFIYSLAVSLGPSFGVQITPDLRELKREAMQRLIAPNMVSPPLGTRDAGIPGSHAGNRSTYNYISKQNG